MPRLLPLLISGTHKPSGKDEKNRSCSRVQTGETGHSRPEEISNRDISAAPDGTGLAVGPRQRLTRPIHLSGPLRELSRRPRSGHR